MTDDADGGLRDLKDRVTRQGEQTLTKVVEELLDSPLLRNAVTQLLEARDKAARAQEAAYGVLNIPSAADIERLTRRVRSLSQRLEGIEDGVDRIAERLAALGGTGSGADGRLRAIEDRLGAIASELATLGAKPRSAARTQAASKPPSATRAKPAPKPGAARTQRGAARKP